VPTVAVNGVDLYYRVDGDGPAVVFCHGRASTHLSWCHQVVALRDRYTCVTYDIRGFGRSTEEQHEPGFAAHSDDLEALLDHLGIDRAFVVGQSMGGFGALQFALRSPQRVLGLVLTSTPAGVNDDALMALVRAAQERAAGMPMTERVFRPQFIETQPVMLYIWRAQQDASTPYPRSFLDPLWYGGGPSAEAVQRLAVPTLILAAEYDNSVPVAAARRLQELLPGSRLQVAADCGHCIYWERPDFYNRALLDFFAEVGAMVGGPVTP
jgi:pimeloyl-ACP methyl ester carboxylesterase